MVLSPDMAREIPYPPALPPVSREGGHVFLEDSSESSRIYRFTRVRVPQGPNHICKGYWGERGRETPVSPGRDKQEAQRPNSLYTVVPGKDTTARLEAGAALAVGPARGWGEEGLEGGGGGEQELLPTFSELLGSAPSRHLLPEVPSQAEVPERPSAAQTLQHGVQEALGSSRDTALIPPDRAREPGELQCPFPRPARSRPARSPFLSEWLSPCSPDFGGQRDQSPEAVCDEPGRSECNQQVPI